MGSGRAKVPQSILELFLVTATTATSSEPSARPAGVSQLSKVIISAFIWPLAELARPQSPNELDPRPAKASSEINRSSYSKRPFISSSREKLQPGTLSRCILGKLTDAGSCAVDGCWSSR